VRTALQVVSPFRSTRPARYHRITAGVACRRCVWPEPHPPTVPGRRCRPGTDRGRRHQARSSCPQLTDHPTSSTHCALERVPTLSDGRRAKHSTCSARSASTAGSLPGMIECPRRCHRPPHVHPAPDAAAPSDPRPNRPRAGIDRLAALQAAHGQPRRDSARPASPHRPGPELVAC